MKPKYLLCPGKVRSASDHQLHAVCSVVLADLYGVSLQECDEFDPKPWWPASLWREAERQKRELIVLKPRADGNYTLPPNG